MSTAATIHTAASINEMKFSDILAWEESLAVGQTVQGRWTNCHNFYSARCEIVRVNRKSLRLRGLEGYMKGRCFPVPRVYADTWSRNNCAAPLPAYDA